jgi:hypothetical protein
MFSITYDSHVTDIYLKQQSEAVIIAMMELISESIETRYNTSRSDMFVRTSSDEKKQLDELVYTHIISATLFSYFSPTSICWNNQKLIQQINTDLEEVKQGREMFTAVSDLSDHKRSYFDDQTDILLLKDLSDGMRVAAFSVARANGVIGFIAGQFNLKPTLAGNMMIIFRNIKNILSSN